MDLTKLIEAGNKLNFAIWNHLKAVPEDGRNTLNFITEASKEWVEAGGSQGWAWVDPAYRKTKSVDPYIKELQDSLGPLGKEMEEAKKFLQDYLPKISLGTIVTTPDGDGVYWFHNTQQGHKVIFDKGYVGTYDLRDIVVKSVEHNDDPIMTEQMFRDEIEAWNGSIDDWDRSIERKCYQICYGVK